VKEWLSQSWQFWALVAAVFAALTAIFAKLGVAELDSNLATLIRTFVVLVAFGVLFTLTGQLTSWPEISARTWFFLILSGLATGASWLAYFKALKLGPASQVAPIDKLSVVLVAIFAALFLGERLSLANWLGVAMIGAGAVLVALKV
jgi:bacterial/archaeal transporter family protein